jgi:Protein of unknown function (DUF2961)
MPFHKSAKITITNEGQQAISAFYYNIDWQKYSELPNDMLHFYAEFRQAQPNVGWTGDWEANTHAKVNEARNVDAPSHWLNSMSGPLLCLKKMKSPAWMSKSPDRTSNSRCSRCASDAQTTFPLVPSLSDWLALLATHAIRSRATLEFDGCKASATSRLATVSISLPWSIYQEIFSGKNSANKSS